MAITGPIYWNGTTFPSQSGDPVAITQTEFEDCCCDPPYDCTTEACYPVSNAIISGGANCTGDCDISELPAGGLGGFSSSTCEWVWSGQNASFTREYVLKINAFGSPLQWFASFKIYDTDGFAQLCQWSGSIDPCTCVDGDLTGSGTLTNVTCDAVGFSVG